MRCGRFEELKIEERERKQQGFSKPVLGKAARIQ